MANFWDLPEAVRKKIYRLHLIQDNPIAYDDFAESCGHTQLEVQLSARRDRGTRPPKTKLMPSLLQADRKIEREASNIYFGENTFELSTPLDIRLWVDHLCLRHLNSIRSIVLKSWIPMTWSHIPEGPKYDVNFKRMASLKSLQRLTVMVDEKRLLHGVLNSFRKNNWHSSLGYGPQVSIQLLYISGMTGFRSIRGIRCLDFLKVGSFGAQGPKQLGSMEDGLLETTIRSEVMLPRAAKQYARAGHLRFLDLPAEVRNMIYELLLIFPGPTYPISGLPTSVKSQHVHMREAQRNAVLVPKSALEILCINRQIHNEAKKLFYLDNDFVFSRSAHLQSFLFTLGDGRLESLRSVTIFHIDYNPDIDTKNKRDLKDSFLILRRLPGLRKFHLLIDFHSRDYPFHKQNPAYQDPTYPASLPHIEGLFKLRNVPDIACRHIPAEDWKNNPASQTPPEKDDMSSSYRHFTFGLQLAQKGLVHSELYSKGDWSHHDLWPVLEGSECGYKKACRCGQKDDDPEKET